MVSTEKVKLAIKDNRRLISNFGYLSILQVINLIIPLAVYPYLIRTLGAGVYGVVVFAQATVGYLQILVNFGFDAAATKDVSIHRKNPIKLNEIVSSVLILKGMLFIVSVGVLSVLLLFLPKEQAEHKLLFFLTLWICLYDLIFPIWYFQGVEKMKFITYFTLISRSIFIGLVFILIKSPEDYLRLPVINGLGAILAGSAALFFIFGVEKVQFQRQAMNVLLGYLKNAFPLFISGVSVKVFAQANKVILGSFLGMQEVAYYDLAEKIVNFLKLPQLTVSQVIFPKISKEDSRRFRGKMLLISVVISLGIVLAVQLFASHIVELLGGETMMASVSLLRLFSLILVFVYISQYTTVHTLLAKGHNAEWMKIVIGAGIIYILVILYFIVTKNVTPANLIYANIASEFYLMIMGYLVSRRHRLF